MNEQRLSDSAHENDLADFAEYRVIQKISTVQVAERAYSEIDKFSGILVCHFAYIP